MSSVSNQTFEGAFYICNLKTGTTIDLYGSKAEDGTKIQCWGLHGATNQQWAIEAGKNGHRIKSCITGTYVGYCPDTRISNSMGVTANANPVEFNIQGDHNTGYT
ncbi:hypothetical protein BDV93DRAFT_565751 [Ceratobasidium sp. AG-I]|nr:hypothetical protein BDV93DRAFT_565751 [Ceratobasidium sp. AG-I]